MKTILISALFGLMTSILFTPLVVKYFRSKGFGQEIRDDGPKSHLIKRGTPTMGGVAIMGSTIVGYLMAHLIGSLRHDSGPTASGMLLLFLMLGAGGVGFLDDFIKLRHRRSLGLRARAKFGGQLLVALLFGAGAMMFANRRGLTPGSKHISYVRDIGAISIGLVGFLLLAYLIITATTNAVNLTDGLDGLVAGSAAMVMGAYTLVTFIQFRNSCHPAPALPGCYVIRDPQDLALIAAAAMGACFGFLWWNASPAKIFMGDTGSLALGGALAGLAITSRTELLLILLGGLFAVITLSVIVQVGFFKLTRRRVFRMAPLQHHFELVGWGEVTIVIRFWIIAGLLVALGLGVFYAEWVTGT